MSQTSACPAAIEAAAAKSQGVDGLSYVGDVTRLPSARLGTFDFFLDIGCFRGLDAEQRVSEGGASAPANPGATVLLVSSARAGGGCWVGGASQEEVEAAFAGWLMLAVERLVSTQCASIRLIETRVRRCGHAVAICMDAGLVVIAAVQIRIWVFGTPSKQPVCQSRCRRPAAAPGGRECSGIPAAL